MIIKKEYLFILALILIISHICFAITNNTNPICILNGLNSTCNSTECDQEFIYQCGLNHCAKDELSCIYFLHLVHLLFKKNITHL